MLKFNKKEKIPSESTFTKLGTFTFHQKRLHGQQINNTTGTYYQRVIFRVIYRPT